jgi:hypothetical protein
MVEEGVKEDLLADGLELANGLAGTIFLFKPFGQN